MICQIKRYPVTNPVLQRYIKFYWTIQAENVQLNHTVIPVRNIDLKFNLNGTPHFLTNSRDVYTLEDVYFSGLHDTHSSSQLSVCGNVDILGICFYADGFYPFIKIPAEALRNQLLGAQEAGFISAQHICNKLKEETDTTSRLLLLERELLALLDHTFMPPESVMQYFNTMSHALHPEEIASLQENAGFSKRKLQRMANRYLGIPAKTYGAIHRFQNSMNQLLHQKWDKLSDVGTDQGYYDQTHFIREFKRFSGSTPKEFIRQKNTMMHVGEFADTQ